MVHVFAIQDMTEQHVVLVQVIIMEPIALLAIVI